MAVSIDEIIQHGLLKGASDDLLLQLLQQGQQMGVEDVEGLDDFTSEEDAFTGMDSADYLGEPTDALGAEGGYGASIPSLPGESYKGASDLSQLPDADLLKISAAALEEEVLDAQTEKVASMLAAQADFFGRMQAQAFYSELKKLAQADSQGPEHLKQAMEADRPPALNEAIRFFLPNL